MMQLLEQMDENQLLLNRINPRIDGGTVSWNCLLIAKKRNQLKEVII